MPESSSVRIKTENFIHFPAQNRIFVINLQHQSSLIDDEQKKKWTITAIILAVFCAALGIYNYYANRSTNEEEVTRTVSPRSKNILNVNGVIIRPQPLTDGITTVGNLLPDEEVDLSFETSGKIVAINFQEGAAVRKGELLAKVNDKPLLAQLSRY